jgi:hypothetical protein
MVVSAEIQRRTGKYGRGIEELLLPDPEFAVTDESHRKTNDA